MTTLHVAVIGYGNMGSAHASAIYDGKIQNMELAAICDCDPYRIQAAGEQFPNVFCCADWHVLLENDNVDALIIAVPHPLHADMAIAALLAGKHVLVEKPVDITCSKASELNRVAHSADRVFAIMFNQRTNPVFQKARELVQSGALGELKRSVWIITNWYRTQSYYDSGSWRATWRGEGGGVLLNQAPHNLDLWQWICGMPSEITAFCDVAKYHNIEVEDDVTIFARYPNGATGSFITTTGEYPGTNRLEISGTKGKIVLENKTLKFWKLPVSEEVLRNEKDKNSSKIEPEYIEYKPESSGASHKGILQNFANAVLKGEPLLSPGTDGINELMISNAAYLSQWKGNSSVSLPFDFEEFDVYLKQKQSQSSLKEQSNAEVNTQYQKRWETNW